MALYLRLSEWSASSLLSELWEAVVLENFPGKPPAVFGRNRGSGRLDS